MICEFALSFEGNPETNWATTGLAGSSDDQWKDRSRKENWPGGGALDDAASDVPSERRVSS